MATYDTFYIKIWPFFGQKYSKVDQGEERLLGTEEYFVVASNASAHHLLVAGYQGEVIFPLVDLTHLYGRGSAEIVAIIINDSSKF